LIEAIYTLEIDVNICNQLLYF